MDGTRGGIIQIHSVSESGGNWLLLIPSDNQAYLTANVDKGKAKKIQ
jgi:hypothetical protein